MTNGSHQGRLVLVVEPDLGFADALSALLEGDRIIAARTMAEAAAISEGGRIDLALIGPSFGTEDGVASASVLRDADRSLLAVLVADVPSNKVLRAALRAGLTDVIDAPVSARKMADLLGRTDALDEARSVSVVFERPGAPVGHAHVAVDHPSEPEALAPLPPSAAEPAVAEPAASESFTHASAVDPGHAEPFEFTFSAPGRDLIPAAAPLAAASPPQPMQMPNPIAMSAPEPLSRPLPTPELDLRADREPDPAVPFAPPPVEPIEAAAPFEPAPARYEAPSFDPPAPAETTPRPISVSAAAPAEVPFQDEPFAPPTSPPPRFEEAPAMPAPPPFEPTPAHLLPAPAAMVEDFAPPMPASPPPVPGFDPSPAPMPPLSGLAALPEKPASEVPMPRRRPGGGRVITVMAGKGGSGKTITATNLAAALTDRLGEDKVVIVDADLQFGDVALMLQIDPIRTIVDVAAGIDDLTEHSLDGLLLRHDSGLRLLAAPLVPAGADKVGPKDVVRAVEMLRGMYAYVVIDTAPIFDDGLITILEHSDDVLMVVDMDLPSVKNAKIALDTLRAIGYDMGKVSVIVNRANSKARLDLAELERALGEKVAASIPSDRLVPQSVNEGVPAVAFSPRSRVAKAFHTLAELFLPA